MKKYFFIGICLVIMFMFAGCSLQAVKNGSPISREDFYVYKDGEIVDDPDKKDDGTIFISTISEVTTARGIGINSSFEDVEKAYGEITKTPENQTAEISGASYTLDGYILTISFTNEIVTSICIQNSKGVEISNNQMTERLQNKLKDTFEEWYGE